MGDDDEDVLTFDEEADDDDATEEAGTLDDQKESDELAKAIKKLHKSKSLINTKRNDPGAVPQPGNQYPVNLDMNEIASKFPFLCQLGSLHVDVVYSSSFHSSCTYLQS
jgi:hypothetical protein